MIDSIAINQILILLLQCFIVAVLLLFLFRLRTIFGMGLLFTALGVFQYMQVFLAASLYIEVIPGIMVTPGSMVMFTGSLFAVLLIYIREDALEARKVIYALLAANLVLALLQIVFSWAVEGDFVTNIYNLPKEFFTINSRFLFVGTIVLFIDAFVIIFIYEAIARNISSLFLRMLITMILVLAIDTTLFSLGTFAGTDQFKSIFVSGLVSKFSSAIVYSTLFSIYLVYLDKGLKKNEISTSSFQDIFHTLTYRQKFEQIYKESEIQKIELQQSEDYNRLLFNTSPTGLALCKLDGSLVDVNPAYAKILGRTIDETLKLTYWDITPEKYSTQEELQIKSLEETGKYGPYEKEYINKDGDLIPVVLSGVIVEKDDQRYIMSSVEDITERKQFEKALQNNEARLSEAQHIAKIGSWELDLVTNKLIWSNEVYQLFGIEHQITDITFDIFMEYIHPDDRDMVGDAYAYSVKNKKPYNIVHRILLKNSIIKYVHEICETYYDDTNKPIRSLGTVQDITEQKQAEDELKRQSLELETINSFGRSLSSKLELKDVLNTALKGIHSVIEPDITFIFIREGDKLILSNLHPTNAESKLGDIPEHRVGECICGRTVQEKKPMFSIDIFEDNRCTWNECKQAGIKSFAALPLMNKEEVIGVIGLASNTERDFEKEAKFLETMVGQVSTTLVNAQLYKSVQVELDERKRAEKALYQSEEKFRSFVEQASEGIYLYEMESPIPINMSIEDQIKNIYKGHIIEANDSQARMYGYTTAEKLLGVTLAELHGGTDNPVNIEFIKSWIEAGYRIAGSESEELDKDGNKVWFSNNIIGFIENGYLMRLWGTQTNITAQKEAKVKLEKFANRLQILHKMDKYILAAESPEKIALSLLVDMAKFISFKIATVTEYDETSDSFTRVLVFPDGFDSNVDNKPILTSEYEILDLKLLKSGKVQIVEDLRKKRTNYKNAQWLIDKGLYSTVLIPLISEGKLLGIINFAGESMDVFPPDKIEIATEVANQLAISFQQWKLREEIISYTEELEQKVKQRTEQLEHSNQELREFAQIVSHDLKAPLRAISQLSYWVWKDYSDKIDEEGQEKLKMMIGRVKRLDNLIEGILQYSRAGRQREKEIPINLQLLVEESINLLDPPSNIKIIIENQLPEYIGDPTRLGQLFQNLINNAIKFMDKPNGLIKIGCTLDADNWQFYISDNGPGIEEKYFNRIFQIFQRLISRDEQEGTGIGLSLAKRIVHIYGGEIWLTSTYGEGTTFYFTLRL